MDSLFNVNGLIFWSEREIRLRNQIIDQLSWNIQQSLWETNPAWKMVRVEAPILTPVRLINSNYTNDDVYFQETIGNEEDLVLRPETTPGSYVAASHLLSNHSGNKLPLCVWQVGKSFRREQDQPTKHMRLKEFYQAEFQCMYAADSGNDYHAKILQPIEKIISDITGLNTRVIPSDRLPSYSEITMDIEVWNNDKWMEVSSISRRNDFPEKVKIKKKDQITEIDIKVLEIAIGVDRLVSNTIIRMDQK